jgi:hypothetical protein
VDLEIDFRTGGSLRRQLEDALRVAIRSGRLMPGSALPPSRDLAEQLGVSRGVVVDSSTHAPSAPALLLGFALPTESELITATRLLAEAIC